MSTLKTTFIQHPSAEEPSIELSADGTIVLPLSDLEDLANVSGSPSNGQVLTYNATSGNWEAKDLKMKEKRIEAFTGSGDWTVPDGVTYAIAHIRGAGGGTGTGTTGGDGGASSVAFSSGTVTAAGGKKGIGSNHSVAEAGAANSGEGAIGQVATGYTTTGTGQAKGGNGAFIVAAADVTPAASITVTVGAGGTQGTVDSGSGVGGSGYVYIEYYEEV